MISCQHRKEDSGLPLMTIDSVIQERVFLYLKDQLTNCSHSISSARHSKGRAPWIHMPRIPTCTQRIKQRSCYKNITEWHGRRQVYPFLADPCLLESMFIIGGSWPFSKAFCFAKQQCCKSCMQYQKLRVTVA